MVSKLPKWFEWGAFLLSLTAGFVNAIGLLGFNHQSVSHLSGIATRIGYEAASRNGIDALHLVLIMGSFVFGAMISGFLIRSSEFQLGWPYAVILLIESALLLSALTVLNQGSILGHYLASMACGLQNAMVTTYSGAIIRTTHVTGVVTDLGLWLGARLRGGAFNRRKIQLYGLLVAGFILGGWGGSVAFIQRGFNALLIPVGLTFFMGIMVVIFMMRRSRSSV